MPIKASALLLLVAILVSSCGPEIYFANETKILNDFTFQDTVDFKVEVTDSIQHYNYYLTLSHDDSYPYSNLYIYSTTTLPNGGVSRDTIEMYLARPDGKWLGDGWFGGDIKHKILFYKNKRFPMAGDYRIAWTHGLRDSIAPGIKSLGLSIEKVQ